MTIEEYEQQLAVLLKESNDIEERAQMVEKTTNFLCAELDRIASILDNTNLSFDEKEEIHKQFNMMMKRMEKEIVICKEEENRLLEYERKFIDLQIKFGRTRE